MPSTGDLFYEPSQKEIDSTVVEEVRLYINDKYATNLKDVWDLHAFSCDRADDYFTAIASFCHLILEREEGKPLFDTTKPMNETQHLINARMNWSENMLLAHTNARSKTKTAIIGCSEQDFVNTFTHEELYQAVRLATQALKDRGAKEGDRIAAFSANNAECLIMLLAAVAIGCTFISTSTDLGVTAILERLDQVQPTILLTADRYAYNGKTHDLYSKLEEVVAQLAKSRLKHVVIVGQCTQNREPKEYDRAKPDGVHFETWNAFQKSGKGAAPEIVFDRGSAMRPIWILFSSGTTGKPKCIIHTQGGMLLSAASANTTSFDARSDDILLQFASVSWMMWQYAIQHMINGLTLVLFDGSPLAPPGRLWSLIEQHKVTMLGISPRYLQVLHASGYQPNQHYNLESLRTIGVVGAPCPPELYDFIRDKVKHGIFINNGSGGTDICAKFVGACRTLPVYYGEIQMPLMGCKIEAWSDEGKEVPNGQEGHMACTRPIPNLPLSFLNDPGNKRYNASYFESFPGSIAWNQSDWIVISPKTRGLVMHGRSDGVLNPAGIRFGSAELYAVVEKISDIDDCIAVGQKVAGGDERVVLFLKTKDQKPLEETKIQEVKKAIRTNLSARHVPEIVTQAPDLPYTTNMKRCEIAVKKVINNTPIDKVNVSAMANPKSLDWFVDRPELRLQK